MIEMPNILKNVINESLSFACIWSYKKVGVSAGKHGSRKHLSEMIGAFFCLFFTMGLFSGNANKTLITDEFQEKIYNEDKVVFGTWTIEWLERFEFMDLNNAITEIPN